MERGGFGSRGEERVVSGGWEWGGGKEGWFPVYGRGERKGDFQRVSMGKGVVVSGR